ncbi:glutamyl-tRNA amidotransferase [Candidatus Woesebacteria bacterium]|nr:glutamyl-tRNA amidotransferase [Candidatus Woesebacteria bacterium]|tara:strand:- start:634 stop:1080 length:447 start_codon:yes stop_codon:yes gene_type:complete
MNLLKSKIDEQVKEALKARDEIRVSTFRLLSNALHNEQIAKQSELTEEEEIQIVRRQLKQREESIEAYEKGGRQEAAEKEKKEAEILKEFLPAQMDSGNLEKIVDEVISQVNPHGPADFGKVMGAVMGKVKGQVDGKTVGDMVKKKLN